jgi:hypothetical protein
MKLYSVNNDTGEAAYCGPTVICAITGKPLSEVLAVIKDRRTRYVRVLKKYNHSLPKNWDLTAPEITSVTTFDIERTFPAFDFHSETLAYYDKTGPTLAHWLSSDDHMTAAIVEQYRKGAALVFAIGQDDFDEPDGAGHLIVISDGTFLDTSTNGKPIPCCEGENIAENLVAFLSDRVDCVHIVTTPDPEEDARFAALMEEALARYQK